MSEVSGDTPSFPSVPRERHGCLTTYLVFAIIVNAAMCLVYFLSSDRLRQNGVNAPNWAFEALAVCGLINVIAAVALFRWRRWGFWLFVASAIAGVAINVSIGLGLRGAIGAALGVAILYGVLHIGKEKKAWPQLQ